MRILCGTILAAAMTLAANGVEVVSFKDAAKIKTWDAWHDHEKGAAKMPLENWLACMDYGDTTPVKPGERVKHRYFETRFTLPPEAKGRRV